MADVDWTEFPIPTLMRSARGVYAQSIRAQLQLLGVDDLPRNGVFILAGIDTERGPVADLPAELGVTKQAVSQAVDILVAKGYVERRGDLGDRRRVVLELTDRGRKVVAAVQRGVDAVDHQLAEQVPAGQIDAMRSALIALTGIKGKGIATGAGQRRPARQLRRFSPVFSVRDLHAATASPAAMGWNCTWPPIPSRTRAPPISTSATPTRSTTSGAGPVSAATPTRSDPPTTSSARVPMSTRTAT